MLSKPGFCDPHYYPLDSGCVDQLSSPVKDVIQPIYDEINKQYGINEKQD